MNKIIKREINISIALIVVVLLMLVSCATKSTQQNLYSVVNTGVVTYNTSFDVLQSLNSAGRISDEDKIIVKDLMIKAELALKTSTDALSIYVQEPTITNQELTEKAVLALNTLLAELRFIIGGLDE